MSTLNLTNFQEQEYKIQFMIYLGTTFYLLSFILIFTLIWENLTLSARIEKLEHAEKLQLLSNEGLSGLIRNIQENMPIKDDVAMMSELFHEHYLEIRNSTQKLDKIEDEIGALNANFLGLCRENESILKKQNVDEKKIKALSEDIETLAERAQKTHDDFEENKKINKYNQETLLENQDALAAALERLQKTIG